MDDPVFLFREETSFSLGFTMFRDETHGVTMVSAWDIMENHILGGSPGSGRRCLDPDGTYQ